MKSDIVKPRTSHDEGVPRPEKRRLEGRKKKHHLIRRGEVSPKSLPPGSLAAKMEIVVQIAS